MSTFLFAVQPAMGHVNPMLSIAHQLRKNGHTIIFLSFAPEKIRKIIEGNGFNCIGSAMGAYKLAMFILSLHSGFLETYVATKMVFQRLTHFSRIVGQYIDQVQPDVLVVDFAFPGACLAAQSRKIPHVMIYHAGLRFQGPGIPPFGSGLPINEKTNWGWRWNLYRKMAIHQDECLRRAIARTRKHLGIKPLTSPSKDILQSLSPYLTLVLTSEAIEAPRFPPEPTVYFIGPCLTERQDEPGDGVFPFEKLSYDKPKIYVSMGTFFNRKPKIFRKIIDAFSDNNCQLIVKCGRSYNTLRSIPFKTDVLLFENIPQLKILPEVNAVISHGGNNTVNESLYFGKPLLIIPHGGEQGDNAARVEYLGAGLRADARSFTSGEIREKIQRILEVDHFRKRTEKLSLALRETEGPETAASFIDRVAETKEPLIRPDGYPLSITKDMPPPWSMKDGGSAPPAGEKESTQRDKNDLED